MRKSYGRWLELIQSRQSKFVPWAKDDGQDLVCSFLHTFARISRGLAVINECYLVDPASSHMLVSKIKPCMCKYERIQTVKLRMAH